MKIIPTIGRQVWFFRAGANLQTDQAEAATVCYVHSESLVNLQVIDRNGEARSETSVSLRQPDDPPWETTPFAEWMPYQKGQAAKTEQLEKKLAPAAGETVEQEIQRKGLTAPRVTPAHIEANIAEEYFTTAAAALKGTPGETSGPLQLLTLCVLVLNNGFTILGKSACASPENFDAELGRKIARQDAVNQIWPLMGYALREKLAAGGAT